MSVPRLRPGAEPLAVRAVVFDLGSTLVDESRLWESWADWLAVPHLDLIGLLGASIARGDPHREAFRLMRPGLDVEAETVRRAGAGVKPWPLAQDLFPDARRCLDSLRAARFRIGIAGNQSADEEALVAGLGLAADFVGSSSRWGAQKPDAAFFDALIEAAGFPPNEIAYVGDRPDNDVRPAARAGLRVVFLRRGPWAWIQAGTANPPEADVTIDTLDDLLGCLSLAE